ncbi:MAG: efflux RND transporter periplasmic adaptor subunit, partial [Deltaproteobacteria bacterium]|nr:efflux RND transporter periplasmic adaptor subunit [Deltaproteobacteria bacterium]
DAQLKQAEALVNQSKALVNIAKKRVSDTEVISPIAGEVKKKLVSTGETIKDKTALFIIVKNDPLKLKAQVSEQFLKDIKIGQAVEVNIDAFSETKFTGEVSRVSPAVDEKTRAMDIEIKIPNPKKVLKSGLFAKAYVLVKKEKEVPFAPESAVYSFVGVNKVYVVKDNKVQDRTVKTGIRENGFVEIVEGVKSEEIVAASSLDQLFEGAKVEITSR